MRHRWDVEPKNAFFGLLLPLVRPLIERSLKRDLESIAKRAVKLAAAPEPSGETAST